MIKMWRGPILHDFVSRNLDGLLLITTKRVERKESEFRLGVHEYIFEDVANIYDNGKRVCGITAKVPFIIVKDDIMMQIRRMLSG